MLRSTLFKLSSLLLLLFATSAHAYDNAYFGSFSNWSGSFQSCQAYSGGNPCVSDGTYFSVSSGSVVFAYTNNTIYKQIGTTHDMRIHSGDSYLAMDLSTGPRNAEQGTKTEYVNITVQKTSSTGTVTSLSFSENITNTSLETFAYNIGSLSGIVFVKVIISGRDGGYWAGNYGAVIGTGSLYIADSDPTAVQSSPTPVYSSGITSTQSTKRSTKLSETNAQGGMIANIGITGGSNTVDVYQSDAEHYLELSIVGNTNAVDIDQTQPTGTAPHYADVVISGNRNTLDLLQTGTGGKTAFIDVDGDDNVVDVIQKDSGQHYLQLDLIGDDHSATIVQEGSGSHDATVELTNGGGAWDFNLNQKGTTDKEYSLPHSMSDGSTTSGTCYVAAGCSATIIQND